MQNPGTDSLNGARLLEQKTSTCTYTARVHTNKPLTPTERAFFKTTSDDQQFLSEPLFKTCHTWLVTSLRKHAINIVAEIVQCQSAQYVHKAHTVAASYLL